MCGEAECAQDTQASAVATLTQAFLAPPPHADAGYGLASLWERLSVGRDYVYDSTTTRLHSSGMYGVGDVAGASRQCDPSPGRLVCVDFALASFLGQGVVCDNVGASLWDPADPDAAKLAQIFSAWAAFFTTHRAILTSAASLHIVRPTARTLEARASLRKDAHTTYAQARSTLDI